VGTAIEQGDPRFSSPSTFSAPPDHVKTTVGIRNLVQGQRLSDLHLKVTWLPSTEKVGPRLSPRRITREVAADDDIDPHGSFKFWRWRADEREYWARMMAVEMSGQAEYSERKGYLECRIPGVVVVSMRPPVEASGDIAALVSGVSPVEV
jgi:hypothetical protein